MEEETRLMLRMLSAVRLYFEKARGEMNGEMGAQPRQARRRAPRSRHGCGSAPVPLRASVSSVHLGVEGSGATRRKRPPQADFFDARSARV